MLHLKMWLNNVRFGACKKKSLITDRFIHASSGWLPFASVSVTEWNQYALTFHQRSGRGMLVTTVMTSCYQCRGEFMKDSTGRQGELAPVPVTGVFTITKSKRQNRTADTRYFTVHLNQSLFFFPISKQAQLTVAFSPYDISELINEWRECSQNNFFYLLSHPQAVSSLMSNTVDGVIIQQQTLHHWVVTQMTCWCTSSVWGSCVVKEFTSCKNTHNISTQRGTRLKYL